MRYFSTTGKTVKLVEISVLTALTVVLTFFSIPILTLELTLAPIPVLVGAILYGPLVGGFLGGCFGACSFIMCFTTSPFGQFLLGISWFRTFLVCFPTRVLMGVLVGLIFKAISRKIHSEPTAYGISSFTAPFLNTLFFLGSLMILFSPAVIAGVLGAAAPSDVFGVFSLIIAMAGINCVVELISCTVIGSAICLALKKIR